MGTTHYVWPRPNWTNRVFFTRHQSTYKVQTDGPWVRSYSVHSLFILLSQFLHIFTFHKFSVNAAPHGLNGPKLSRRTESNSVTRRANPALCVAHRLLYCTELYRNLWCGPAIGVRTPYTTLRPQLRIFVNRNAQVCHIWLMVHLCDRSRCQD